MPALVKTDCYKCEAEAEAPRGTPHPLCLDCQIEFDDWFGRQLTMFKK